MTLRRYVALLSYVHKPEVVPAFGEKKVFHAMANLGIPLSDRHEVIRISYPV